MCTRQLHLCFHSCLFSYFQESFGRCNNWARDLDRYLYERPDTVKYLVGNKVDEKQLRKISYDNAKVTFI